jgi:DNA-binding IclR family transcriptional regulator
MTPQLPGRTTDTDTRGASLPGLVRIDDMAGDRQFAIALARDLEILRAFTPGEPMLGNRDLCQRTGLPKATVSRLSYTLMMLGYLDYNTTHRKYQLGPGVLTLGHPLLASLTVRQRARPLMERLATTTRCTVNLAMRDRLSMVYVESCRIDTSNPTYPDIGSALPLLRTAAGRALILASAHKQQAAILNRLRLDDGDGYERMQARLESDRSRLRREGWCMSEGEWRQGIHALAVPLNVPGHAEPFALNCTTASHRRGENGFASSVGPLLIETVRLIEQACAQP